MQSGLPLHNSTGAVVGVFLSELPPPRLQLFRQSVASLIFNSCTQVNIVWFLGAAGFCHVEASDYEGDWSSAGVDGSVVVHFRINPRNQGKSSAMNIANFGFEVYELYRLVVAILSVRVHHVDIAPRTQPNLTI